LTTEHAAVDEAEPRPTCWCCGNQFPEAALVRLGAHPGVGVCHGCARFLHRMAKERTDALHPSVRARGRSVVRAARGTVVKHRWHEAPVIGPLLQWIDKRLP
jgi:hypothetical protein